MNILITGGSGFIGSHLAAHYESINHDVFIVDNLITGNKKNISALSKARFFQEDVCTFDFTKLPSIDIAFHLASPASPVQYKKHPIETMMTNSLGTQRLFEQAKNHHVARIVLASTSEVYGDPLEHPQKESYHGNVNSFGPRACYDESKRFAEALAYSYIHKYGLDIRIVRIFNTYGPNMEINDGRVISNFITQCVTGKPITIYGDGQQTRSLCYISDLVTALCAMGEEKNLGGEIINLGNPNEKTVLEVAQKIKQMTGSASEIIFQQTDADDPKKRRPDITRAKELLSWEPQVDLESGLTKTIEYFKSMVNS